MSYTDNVSENSILRLTVYVWLRCRGRQIDHGRISSCYVYLFFFSFFLTLFSFFILYGKLLLCSGLILTLYSVITLCGAQGLCRMLRIKLKSVPCKASASSLLSVQPLLCLPFLRSRIIPRHDYTMEG